IITLPSVHILFILVYRYIALLYLYSFPTRRSSDLVIRCVNSRLTSAACAVDFASSEIKSASSILSNTKFLLLIARSRSEERRVGKECRARWWEYDENKKIEI